MADAESNRYEMAFKQGGSGPIWLDTLSKLVASNDPDRWNSTRVICIFLLVAGRPRKFSQLRLAANFFAALSFGNILLFLTANAYVNYRLDYLLRHA